MLIGRGGRGFGQNWMWPYTEKCKLNHTKQTAIVYKSEIVQIGGQDEKATWFISLKDTFPVVGSSISCE